MNLFLDVMFTNTLILFFYTILLKYRGRYLGARIGNGSRVGIRTLLAKQGRGYLNIGIGSFVQCQLFLARENSSISIGDNTFISQGSSLFCTENIVIKNNVQIAWGCTLIDTNSHSLDGRKRRHDLRNLFAGKKTWDDVHCAGILIEDDVWIGFNSIILKGVCIGRGSIVAAGSVVTKNVPDFSLVAGNPAKVIRSLS